MHAIEGVLLLRVYTAYRHSALDLAMLEGHMGCADYLISVGVSTGGGAYHRAAATIQAVWRYHRHKVGSLTPLLRTSVAQTTEQNFNCY